VLACVAALLGASSFCAVAGFYRMFTLLSPYDDEGYVLVLLRAFRAGKPLYDEVYSQYGPFFAEAMSWIFGGTGLPLDHDHGRLVSLALWIAASLCFGAWAALLSGSALAAAIVQLLVFRAVWPYIAYEPLHPAVLVCLLLALLVLTTAAEIRRPRLAAGLQGALVAALTLVKINVGALAALALLLRWIPNLVASTRRASALLIAALGVVAPLLLLGPSLGAAWVRTYLELVEAAIVPVLMVQWHVADNLLSPVPPGWLLAGATMAATPILGIALLRGSSLDALARGVLVGPLGHAGAFSLPLLVPPGATLVALASAAACVAALLATHRDAAPFAPAWLGGAVAVARIAVGYTLLATAIGFALPGGWSIGFWSAPLAWVVAWPLEGDPPAVAAARRLLPPLAVLQTLQAYPVAGTQVVWSSVLLVLLGLLSARDGVIGLTRWLGSSAPWGAPSRLGTAALALGVALSAGSFAGPLVTLRHDYATLVPLNLPGTQLVRVSPRVARRLRRLTEAIDENCDNFIGLPGLDSLYLWAQRTPPTALNHNAWMFTFDPALQERVVRALTPIDRLCVVRQEGDLDFWRQERPLPDGPLLRYVEEGFVPLERFGGYILLVRAPR
jgi:hypothetical protein